MHSNYRIILKTIGVIMMFTGTAMFIPMVYAIYLGQTTVTLAFFIPALFCLTFGFLIHTRLKFISTKLKYRDSYFVAFICWITVAIVGTFPYLLSGCDYSLADCFFESVAGWTTTGAWTIDIPSMPNPLLLWKAITNWLGGMGLLLLTISFFPVLGVDGQKMITAELPGIEIEKMSARISDTAKISYKIYIVMTAIEVLLLLPSELTPFEALVNTMSTISTAGILSVDSGNIIESSPYVTGIFTAFSIFGSVNFMMYFYLYKRQFKRITNNVEASTFLRILLIASLVIAVSLYCEGLYDNLAEAWGIAFVQTVSFGSTSGYEVANINMWPGISKMILLVVVFIGGCSNSTSGSIKVIRFVIFIKLVHRGIYKRIHPRAMKPIMIKDRPVSAASVSSITVFLILYFLVFVIGSLGFSLENMDMETTFSTTLACITNNGTAFGNVVGGNFSIFSTMGKIWASVLMLAGRLEMYAVILLFSRSFWNPNRARM